MVPQRAAMGAREVVLIGGEAYLHPGFLQVVRALRAHGMVPVITTGGRGIDATLAQRMAEAGLARTSVSLDGLAPAHDALRARRGSFAQGMAALAHLRAANTTLSVNTTLHRHNIADLEGLYEELLAAGVRSWQVQLMAPLGRAADHPERLLQPWELLPLSPPTASLAVPATTPTVITGPATWPPAGCVNGSYSASAPPASPSTAGALPFKKSQSRHLQQASAEFRSSFLFTHRAAGASR